MTLGQISAADIAGWDSLDEIAASFEKRGLEPRPEFGGENELALQLTDEEFVVLVEAGPGESATEYRPTTRNRRTTLVATDGFEQFTLLTRLQGWNDQQHGRITHQTLSFTKTQMTGGNGERNTVLRKLNSIEYGSVEAGQEPPSDTTQIVTEFYEGFEALRTELVQEVDGIPDDRGDAKQRYVKVILDRMIFLYFLQEKGLLDGNLAYLHDQHRDAVTAGRDVYETFYRPLLFGVLGDGKQSPAFGSLPYLNGGPFSRTAIEEEFDDARLGASTERTNDLFGTILDFLSDWNWNVDERLDIVDRKTLSPAVLGHIFEQTVNQKEMGAYYTPEEITGFMARRSIHPHVLAQLNDEISGKYESIDDVFGLSGAASRIGVEGLADSGGATIQAPVDQVETAAVETLYHDVVPETRVLDPAVGSGAFLLAAQAVLLDIALQCIEFFQQVEAEGRGRELSSRTREELDAIESSGGGASLYAKRKLIRNDLYGVDIDPGAVEVCKLRLWLSMVADIEAEPRHVEPLPDIDLNIRQGNSLIGYTDPQEPWREEAADAARSNYGGSDGPTVADLHQDVIDEQERYRAANTATEARQARRAAEAKITAHSQRLNEHLLEIFRDLVDEELTATDLESFSPFHWAVEFATVYQDGGFDVLIGNPPWDVVKSDRDHFFPKYDPAFRQRPPAEKDATQAELLSDVEIRSDWERFQAEMDTLAAYFNQSAQYTLQDPTVDGRTVASENDLSMLFLERVLTLAPSDAHVTQLLPGNTFIGASAKDLRTTLLSDTAVQHHIQFENQGIFDDLHRQYKFCITTFRNSGTTDFLRGRYSKGSTDVLLDFDDRAVDVPRAVLAEFSPEAGTFPFIRSAEQISLLHRIVQQPSIGATIDDAWFAEPYTELHRAQDADRFLEDEAQGDYPVYGGGNIYQFTHDASVFDDIAPPEFWSVEADRDPGLSAKRRIREKQFNAHDERFSPKKAIYEAFDGSGPQKTFVNDLLERHGRGPLSAADVLLDCTEYRLAYREIANSTNERALIATVLPPGVVCHHKIHTIRPYVIEPTEEHLSEEPLHGMYSRVFSDRELFAAAGLLNSLVFDYLIRMKIDTGIVMYKFRESQVPRLTAGDDWFEYIWRRAARLNCYGDAFADMRERLGGVDPVTEMRERRALQAEIDAAACYAYGLDRTEVDFLLEDFHTVDAPRMMDDDYFDSVRERYRRLAPTTDESVTQD